MQVAVARIFDLAGIVVVMMIAIMTMMMGMTVVVPVMMMVVAIVMVMVMLMASIELGIAFAIDTNVLRPAAAYLAHGYLPLLVVDGVLVLASPA